MKGLSKIGIGCIIGWIFLILVIPVLSFDMIAGDKGYILFEDPAGNKIPYDSPVESILMQFHFPTLPQILLPIGIVLLIVSKFTRNNDEIQELKDRVKELEKDKE